MHHGRDLAVNRASNGVGRHWTAVVASVLIYVPPLQAVGQTELNGYVSPAAYESNTHELNISIAVFEPGVPADPLAYDQSKVFPRVREIEALLIPFVLRETLAATDEWGAVRVVPEPDTAAEVSVSGEILRSDGNALELQIRAFDASGRVWLDETYVSVEMAGGENSGTDTGMSRYQRLFDSVAEDLRIARTRHTDKALTDLVDLSFLRYAYQLAPSVFDGYVASVPDGTFTIQRLPAENDPMQERIEQIRQVEYTFIDTVDEKFQELHSEIESIYNLWVDYRRQVAQFENSEVQRVNNGRSDAPRGSYEAIRSLYDNYSLARMQEQRRESRAEAFENEVAPTVTRMESRVAELESWLDEQYEEWRSLLAEVFYLETGQMEQIVGEESPVLLIRADILGTLGEDERALLPD